MLKSHEWPEHLQSLGSTIRSLIIYKKFFYRNPVGYNTEITCDLLPNISFMSHSYDGTYSVRINGIVVAGDGYKKVEKYYDKSLDGFASYVYMIINEHIDNMEAISKINENKLNDAIDVMKESIKHANDAIHPPDSLKIDPIKELEKPENTEDTKDFSGLDI